MYSQNSILLAGILLASSLVATLIGHRLGRQKKALANGDMGTHIGAIQSALLGLLALLLGFTFSLALQRYDSRSEAVVDEANAIGTAYLRAGLLPLSARGDVQTLLKSYLDGRVEESDIPLSNQAERQAQLAQAGQDQAALWRYALQAAAEDPNPVTTGLFIDALNALIDAHGSRNAALDRHVPELIMLLLYGAFAITWGIVGFTSGAAGHRPSPVAYITLVLTVVVALIIIDLDRPRRGLIQIDHTSLTDLQAALHDFNPSPLTQGVQNE